MSRRPRIVPARGWRPPVTTKGRAPAVHAPCHGRAEAQRVTSKRSSSITLTQAFTKSATKRSAMSACA